MPMKTSPENITPLYFNYVTIIPPHSNCRVGPNNPGSKLIGMAFKSSKTQTIN